MHPECNVHMHIATAVGFDHHTQFTPEFPHLTQSVCAPLHTRTHAHTQPYHAPTTQNRSILTDSHRSWLRRSRSAPWRSKRSRRVSVDAPCYVCTVTQMCMDVHVCARVCEIFPWVFYILYMNQIKCPTKCTASSFSRFTASKAIVNSAHYQHYFTGYSKDEFFLHVVNKHAWDVLFGITTTAPAQVDRLTDWLTD